MVKILKENLFTLDTRLAELRESKKAPVTVKKTDVAAGLKKNWILLDNDGRLEFLQKFVKRIVVEKPKDRFCEAMVTEIEFHEIVE